MNKKLLLLLALMPFIGFTQFTQNFDAGTTIPAGWSVINGGDTGTWIIVDFSSSTTIAANSGTNAAAIGYGSTAHADYLVTPSISVIAGVSDNLSFWGRSRDASYPETISVRISTTTPTAAAFTNVLAASIAPASGTAFYQYQYDLSAYVGQTIYIGFYSSTTDMFYFDLDDVVVSGILSNENFTSSKLNVYPNPAQNILNINYNEVINRVEIFNILGQSVIAKNINAIETSIDLSELTSGTYIANIIANDGVKTVKIIKE